MRVVEITEPGGPDVLRVTERAVPQPGRGEVLIRVSAAGVNRPDVVQRLGLYPPPPGASDIPGLEVGGEIVALGDGVADFALGDQVCALVAGGGYAEYCVAPAATTLPIPQNLSVEEAAALPETFFTVWSNVFERGKLERGERILVHGGSSGIGSTAIQLANAYGAEVFATVGSERKAEFCRELGAHMVINYREQDFEHSIMEATGGAGVNLVLDMVGGAYIPKNINILAKDGRHVSIAFLNGKQGELDIAKIMQRRLTLTGSTLRPSPLEEKGYLAESISLFVLPLVEEGKVKPVIDRVFPFDEASAAHSLMESSDHMGKIVLSFG